MLYCYGPINPPPANHLGTMTTLSPAETTRLNFQNLDTTTGLPPLPYIPQSFAEGFTPDDELTPDQQEANLLHVALWIVERDRNNFYMNCWHSKAPVLEPTTIHNCGTVHCIAGFAQVMAGETAFSYGPEYVGHILLGEEASDRFHDDTSEGLDFLKEVIARNS